MFAIALLLFAVQDPMHRDDKAPSWHGAIKLADSAHAPVHLAGRAWLDSPGGEIPFQLDIELIAGAGKGRGWIVGAGERSEFVHSISIADLVAAPNESAAEPIFISIEHYDAVLTGRPKVDIEKNEVNVDGEWRKRRGPNEWARLPFHARMRLSNGPIGFTAKNVPSSLDGRWAAQFSTDADPSVAIFRRMNDHELLGTFLTTTGDYRYLWGEELGDKLWLSAFDGAHAFLFKATKQPDGTLAGDFWSGDRHHETWTARKDDDASLPDGFALAKVNDGVDVNKLSFPDLDGNVRSLGDPAFAGKARVMMIFGSWCPNCHDEAAFLGELYTRYADRGLSIVGLAFELTGDAKRDADQVRRYAARHHVTFPLLIAGTSDKTKAAAAFPLLDRIRAYPTTIFLHADGRVRAVHTGFSGPATGKAHDQLRTKFAEVIEDLLSQPAPKAP